MLLHRQSSPLGIVMSDKMSIDKEEQCQEHSDESLASTPDNGAEPTPAPQDAQPVKRKGGRKPVREFSSYHGVSEGPGHGGYFAMTGGLLGCNDMYIETGLWVLFMTMLTASKRYTRPLKSVSRGTVKLKLPSERGALNTSSSLRILFGFTNQI